MWGKVKKTKREQNGNINKGKENLKRNQKRKSGAEQYGN